jgi:hypothetical protein
MRLSLWQTCEVLQNDSQLDAEHEMEIRGLQTRLAIAQEENAELEEAFGQQKQMEQDLQARLEKFQRESAQAIQPSVLRNCKNLTLK